MVSAHLTLSEGLMNMLDVTIDVMVFCPHSEMLSFLQMRKDKFPFMKCNFVIWEVLI